MQQEENIALYYPKKLSENFFITLKNLGKSVIMVNEFQKLIRDSLPKSIKVQKIEEDLEVLGYIERKVLKSDNYKGVKRISIPHLKPTPYHFAVSLRSEAYLSHSSAVHILGLTQQQPKVIYVNKEQSPKRESEEPILQESIDRAFSRPQRRSNYIFKIDGIQIVLISGKSTGNVGVITDKIVDLPLTCLERTLIDITVRPRYAGGVFQVSQAYKEAVSNINYSYLLELLSKVNYRYPYHQAIGFYLERANADKDIIKRIKDIGIKLNFYLDYSMANPQFDKSWRVFYPLGV